MAELKKDSQPVWLVTGCSTGLGRCLATHLLDNHYRVVVTARNTDQIADLTTRGEALVLPLDVTDDEQAHASVRAAEERFGKIDVLVNNAGIGYFAAVEESEQSKIRQLFEINFFGAGNMIQAVLPGMRKRRAGHIINITSIGGLTGVMAAGYYCASKFAMEGLSDALAQEVEPFGIKVMLVEPGAFRTEWSRSANESSLRIEDYANTAGAQRDSFLNSPGTQPGDPALAARAIVQVIRTGNAPRRLLLGKDAYEQAIEKINSLRTEFDEWKELTFSTDFSTSDTKN